MLRRNRFSYVNECIMTPVSLYIGTCNKANRLSTFGTISLQNTINITELNVVLDYTIATFKYTT